ncbi:MAG: hypothetical protein Q8M02_00540 [Candidatus Didemnitutus sp.]|nr:hypothetical protein [Candidatus Didemnitutus sp.]
MKAWLQKGFWCWLALAGAAAGRGGLAEWEERLLFNTPDQSVVARLSGTLDIEAYWLSTPPPGLLFTRERFLLNPRLTLLLDAQVGELVYVFGQARVDRGFDPSDRALQVRVDELGVRVTLRREAKHSLQLGQFATVVGNWVPRHGSWENAFVTAPLPYENLTAIWDGAAPGSSTVLLNWAHLSGGPSDEYADKRLRLPVIWGPSYTTGIAAMGEVGRWTYAAEIKNAALSSRPKSWSWDRAGLHTPTVSGRLGFRPNMMWDFGASVSSGTYLRPAAAPTVAPGFGLRDYHQVTLASDVGFAWHHWQLWAEYFHTRFAIPTIGPADTRAYYVEAKYKFTPRLSLALRWNQQTYGRIRHLGGMTPWGRDAWRIDQAVVYRFSPHVQLKFQTSLLHENARGWGNRVNFAAQVTARF